jgi:hypothetical protein
MPSALINGLRYVPCTGAIPGRFFTVPGSSVIAVTYNGVLLSKDISKPFNYAASGNLITLNFSTQTGDRVDAFCL